MTTPAHVAIIMDGNGRWAKARGLPRVAGHRAGVEALRQTVRAAGELGIAWLTVYAFSSENWSRPKSEVSDLMGLLKLFIRRDLAELHQSGVRVRIIGDRSGLAGDIKALLEEAETLTRGNSRAQPGDRLQLRLARRDRAGRRARSPMPPLRATSTPEAITAESFGDAARHGRHPRSGPGHPHQWRDAAFEFPALAGRLQRIRLPAVLLAGFRPRPSGRGAAGLCRARAPLRRGHRARRRVMTGSADAPPGKAGSGQSRQLSNLQLRVASAVVLAAIVLGLTWVGGLPSGFSRRLWYAPSSTNGRACRGRERRQA